MTPLHAIGLFSGRDFDEKVFAVEFPRFDTDIEPYGTRGARRARGSERRRAGRIVRVHIQAARQLVTAAEVESGVAAKIKATVADLMPGNSRVV